MLRRSAILFGEACILGLFIFAGALLAASFYVDTDEFRRQFAQTAGGLIGKTVALKGNIDISLAPGLSLEVNDVEIMGVDEEKTPLAQLQTFRISVRLLPLLSKDVVVRSLFVEGMKVHVVRREDGSLNLGSLFSAKPPASGASAPLAVRSVSVEHVEVEDAAIAVDDRANAMRYELRRISIRTGALHEEGGIPFSAGSQLGLPEWDMTGEVVFKGRLRLDQADAPSVSDTSVSLQMTHASRPQQPLLEMTSTLNVDLSSRTLALIDMRAKAAGVDVSGSFDVSDWRHGFRGQGELLVGQFNPRRTLGGRFPSLIKADGKGLNSASLHCRFSVNDKSFSVTDLVAAVDETTVRGEAAAVFGRQLMLNYALEADTLDLDAYAGGVNLDSKPPTTWADVDLGPLQRLNANGVVSFGRLNVGGRGFHQSTCELDARSGTLGIKLQTLSDDFGPLSGEAQLVLQDSAPNEAARMTGHMSVNGRFDGRPVELGEDGASIRGWGDVALAAFLEEYVCVPEKPVTDALRSLTLDASADLVDVRTLAPEANAAVRDLSFDAVSVEMNLRPVSSDPGVYMSHMHLDAKGVTGVDAVQLEAGGPVRVAIGRNEYASHGMALTARMDGVADVQKPNASRMNGVLAFDSKAKTLQATDVDVETLEAQARGRVSATFGDDGVATQGEIAISGANPRRIVEMLTGDVIETRDPEALGYLTAASQFETSPAGFKLIGFYGEFDGMPFAGEGQGVGWDRPMMQFKLAAGSFSVDRYRPPRGQEGEDARPSRAVPIPLQFLQSLRLKGRVDFDAFEIADVTAAPAAVNVFAKDGDIVLSNIHGALHGGVLSGEWTGEADDDLLKTHLKLHVENMRTEGLMNDLFNRDYVRGEADVSFNLETVGSTDDALLANMNGVAWARVTNGSYRFTGYGAEERARAAGKGREEGKPPPSRTVFRRAAGDFNVKNGVFFMDTMRVEAPPVLQSYGEGFFSLPDNAIDMSIRNDFVAVPSVTIQIVGKLSDPQVRVPTGKIVNETVRNILSLPARSFNFLRELFN